MDLGTNFVSMEFNFTANREMIVSGVQYRSPIVNGLTVQLTSITCYTDLSQHQSHQGLYGDRKNSDLIEP